MLLLLIRHAETEHNVAGLLAGVTDSRLTAHGALQMQRLARHLVHQRGLAFTHILSSDLSRARLTADAVMEAQMGEKAANTVKPQRIALEILREQDFGSLECQAWTSKAKGVDGKSLDPGHPDFKPKETRESMVQRMESFLDEVIHPLLATDTGDETTIVVVSHGIILAFLWRALLQRFGPRSIGTNPKLSTFALGTAADSLLVEHIPAWSNTGYLEVEIKSAPIPQVPDALPIAAVSLKPSKWNAHPMILKTSNCTDHLKGLKRTGGGLGSSPFDAKQKTLEAFIKKPRTEEQIPKAHY